MEIQETPTPTPRKSALPYIIGAGLVILLAAAAFMAVRYFVQPKNAAGNNSGGPSLSIGGGPGGGEPQTFKLDIKPAEELPATRPDEVGMFVERKDNSIFIGTGEVTISAKAEPGQEPQVDANFTGPKVEVVISADTVVYKDTTEFDPEDPEAQVQQTVELGTIDEITEQSSISVWGRKAGDRIIADVIPALGNWDTTKAIKLEPNNYPIWEGVIQNLPVNTTIEWKCIKRNNNDNGNLVWESDGSPNRNNIIPTPGSGFGGSTTDGGF